MDRPRDRSRLSRDILPVSVSKEEFESDVKTLSAELAAWRRSSDALSQQKVLESLTKIGRALEEFVNDRPCPNYAGAAYDESADRFQLLLGAGSAGSRIFMNVLPSAEYPFKLIFPNANVTTFSNGKSLAKAFQELFGSRANNIQPTSDKPYFVLDLGLEVNSMR